MKKFNFLDRRTARSKAEEDLRQKFPKRSTTWIGAKTQRIVGIDDIAAELRAPELSTVISRGMK